MEKQLDIKQLDILDPIEKFTIKDVIESLGHYNGVVCMDYFRITGRFKLCSAITYVSFVKKHKYLMEFDVKELILDLSKQEIAELIQENVFKVLGIKINTGY